MRRTYRVKRGWTISMRSGAVVSGGSIVELTDDQAVSVAEALEPVFSKAITRSPHDKMMRPGGYMKKGMGT